MTEQQREWHLRDKILHVGRKPLVMGIVNVTPDSFSDGGRFAATDAAVAHGLELVHEGADLLDIGGESSRPGATPVPLEEELARVVPVVSGLANTTHVPLSVDTCKAEVAHEALLAGAHVINDITALRGDPAIAAEVRAFGAGVILMHMQGAPATMQANPTYTNVVCEVGAFLEERLQAATELGIGPQRVVLDPGIGFGKTAAHNFQLLARLEEFQRLGRPVCLGVSRKGFLGKLLRRDVGERPAGSLAAVCFALARGAVQVVRVHDVAATRDAVDLFARLEEEINPMEQGGEEH
jgi:dihydropteroate synthase